MYKSIIAKLAVCVLVGSLQLPAAGCFGRFELTRRLYAVNAELEGEVLRSVVTWVFFILPIYGGAAFIDFVVFNVIEFYTGENPVSGQPVQQVLRQGDQEVVLTMWREGQAVRATVALRAADRSAAAAELRLQPDGSASAWLLDAGGSGDGGRVVWAQAQRGFDGRVQRRTGTADHGGAPLAAMAKLPVCASACSGE